MITKTFSTIRKLDRCKNTQDKTTTKRLQEELQGDAKQAQKTKSEQQKDTKQLYAKQPQRKVCNNDQKEKQDDHKET